MTSEDEGYLLDSERPSLQPESRLIRRFDRANRTLHRTRSRAPRRERYPRQRKETSIEQLLGRLIADHGLTAAVRERCVLVFWREIAGARVADRTQPMAIANGVLKLATRTSVLVHELQFFKKKLVLDINAWILANQAWLGAAPIVTDIRVTIGTLTSPETATLGRQQQRHLQRLRPTIDPAQISDADRSEILVATSAVEDPELRAMIERVRLEWNR